MARRPQHPETAAAAARERLDKLNTAIRERLKTPGFGYVIFLFDAAGGRHARDAPTYGEAVAIRDQEMATGLYEKAWLMQRLWNADMSITRDDVRDRAAAYARFTERFDDL